MDAELSRISGLAQKDKSQAYSSLLAHTLSSSNSLTRDLDKFVSTVVASDFPQIVARQVLQDYVHQVVEIQDRDSRKEAMRTTLHQLQPRVNSFEAEVCVLREKYADLLEEDEEFPEAAKVLIGIPLESGSRPDDYKLKVYIRIVRLFLEEEDSTSADTYFNRASLLAHSATDLETQLQFKLCQARMFDYSRRFAEAASKYHEISYVAALADEERIQALTAAIVCAVLAPAGPTRSRILASLYRDDRSHSTVHHAVLSKMFLDHMIRPAEIEAFSATLSPHQLARLPAAKAIVTDPDRPDDDEDELGGANTGTGTGTTAKLKVGPETVLDRAMMEHNVLAASRVYTTLTFRGLGHSLGLRPSAAEHMARTMVQQGRLRATLDQVDQVIVFDEQAGRQVGRNDDAIVSNVAVQAQQQQDDAEGGDQQGQKEEAQYAPATKRWDLQIRQTLQLAESVAARCEALLAQGEGEGGGGGGGGIDSNPVATIAVAA